MKATKRPAQTVMTALLIVSELLVVIAIDRPFTGAVKVPPTALAEVLADIESQSDESRRVTVPALT